MTTKPILRLSVLVLLLGLVACDELVQSECEFRIPSAGLVTDGAGSCQISAQPQALEVRTTAEGTALVFRFDSPSMRPGLVPLDVSVESYAESCVATIASWETIGNSGGSAVYRVDGTFACPEPESVSDGERDTWYEMAFDGRFVLTYAEGQNDV